MQYGSWFRSVLWRVIGRSSLSLVFLGLGTSPAQTVNYSVLHSFAGPVDGAYPYAGLILDPAGNLYGTTSGTFACATVCGTVFKLDRAGNETILHEFGQHRFGYGPVAALLRDTAGNLYGTAFYGGVTAGACGPGCGTVFKLDSTGAMSILHRFTGPPDGSSPNAGLIRDTQGHLYGTTVFGGVASAACSFGCGVVFQLDSAGTMTILYNFTGAPDGQGPYGGLIRDSAGNLYGTTGSGGIVNSVCGSRGCGVVFKLDSTGAITILHSFSGAPGDGAYPSGALTLDEAGNIYGTTDEGGMTGNLCGPGGCGVVFKLDAAGNETILHSFAGAPGDGQGPTGVIRDPAGDLYGTTAYGGRAGGGCGTFGCGVVFKLDSAAKESILHIFGATGDGDGPYGGLVQDASGNLYGTTVAGGASGKGTVFSVKP